MGFKAAPVVASALAALALTAALLRQGPAVALSQLATTDAAPQEQSTTTNFLSDDALALAGEIASERGMEDLVTDADFDAGDWSTAKDNFELLKQFFGRFPGLADNDLYLSGESYGGHYVPTLASLLVGARDAPDANVSDAGYKVAANLKGIMVGNPYTDPVENAHGMYGAYFGRSMVPAKMYQDWFVNCGSHSEMKYYALNYSDWPESITGDMECAELTAAMFDAIGDVDYYGLDFPVCNKAQGLEVSAETDAPPAAAGGTKQAAARASGRTYLNKAEVKNAIHANASLLWAECSLPDTLRYNYDDMNLFMEPVWKKLIEAKLHLLVFSGDDDSICGPIGTQDWLARLADEMGLSDAGETWQAWYYVDPEYGDGQVGGYRVKYQSSDGDMAIAFATVHHAGHEVPMYQPMKGLHVFENYLNGTW
ncbi:serine carboxypeptidase [Aureococcus anophagefferens]|nr:serine carboxypeptidase [Aureococcus anophagefferens]